MGRKALREIDASGQPYSNRGQVQAGMITGIIGSVFLILGILYLIFVVFIFGMAVGIAGHLWGSRDLILAGIFIAGVSSVIPWLVWG